MSEESSDNDDGFDERSQRLKESGHAVVDTMDNDVADDDDDEDADYDEYDDDDDEWEDVDDECVSDSDECHSELTHSVHCSPADAESDTVSNCPDVLTGPQLINLLRSLCRNANSRADVHTVGMVCICSIFIELLEVSCVVLETESKVLQPWSCFWTLQLSIMSGIHALLNSWKT